MKLERYRQKEEDRYRQKEMQMRELREMKQMREELSQMYHQTQQRAQQLKGQRNGDEDNVQGGNMAGSGNMNMREEHRPDVPAMKPPPPPPASVLQLRGGQQEVLTFHNAGFMIMIK